MQNVFVTCKGMDGGTQVTERLSGGQRPARGHFVHEESSVTRPLMDYWIARESWCMHAREGIGRLGGGKSLP